MLVSNECQDAWNWGIASNSAIPLLECLYDDCLMVFLPKQIKQLLRKYTSFSSTVCEYREKTGITPLEWQSICTLRVQNTTYYAPRWTFPFFYFQGEKSAAFLNKVGLDIGARIRDAAEVGIKKLPLSKKRNFESGELLIPHFRYYEKLGSKMTAIDLYAPDPRNTEIEFGDARLLRFLPSSFDFVLIPMLLGPTGPCNTFLELTLSLSELRRVLRPGGFIYIADAGFQPSVAFAAQCLNFDVFSSKGADDLPVGTLLRKRQANIQDGIFSEIFTSPQIQHLIIDATTDEVFVNCNLLYDENTLHSRQDYQNFEVAFNNSFNSTLL